MGETKQQYSEMPKKPAVPTDKNLIQSKQEPATKTIATYALALRAIGGALESLHVEAFDLESRDDGYLVRSERKSSSSDKTPRQSTLRAGLRAAWRQLLEQPAAQPCSKSIEIRYSAEDIEQLDKNGRSKRTQTKGMSDTSRLPQVLRLVGAYLDLKGACLLGLSVREQQISVRYKTALGFSRVEEYRVASLYDFSVNMYLQRADRKSDRPRFAAAF